MKPPVLSNNAIALSSLVLSVSLTAYIFWASHGDPGLRLAVLVAATNTAASLISIASTLLVGRDVSSEAKGLDFNQTKKKEESLP